MDPVPPVTGAPVKVDRLSLDARSNSLKARLRAKGLSMEPSESVGEAGALARSDAWLRRMSAFTKPQIEGMASKLGPLMYAPWPKLDGCLGILFTSRAGSTYLASELAKRFKIGRMDESLNPHLLEGIAPANIIRAYADGWFSFKLGVPGIISAELSGTIEEYLDITNFVMLVRKDIVAQAISLVKANQTGQWHSMDAPKHEPYYDAVELATTIRIIANAVGNLRTYLDLAERPWRKLFYEDFEHGDFSAAEAICNEFQIPRLAEGQGPKLGNLQRTADEVNQTWKERFREDVDKKTSQIIEKYCMNL